MQKKLKLQLLTILLVSVSCFTSFADELIGDDFIEQLIAEMPPLEILDNGNTLLNAAPPKVFIADPTAPRYRVPSPINLITAQESASANVTIDYVPALGSDALGQACAVFPETAKVPFNAAAAIWANIIRSNVPITIRACWASLSSPTVLGYAGFTPLHRNFSSIPTPRANTYYQGSLANALAGSDLNPAEYDMQITYNSNFSWYYGTDGNTPAGQYDLMSVVLHEIAHGLNFSGLMKYASGVGSWVGSYPSIYDVFMRDGSGSQIINTAVYPTPSTALGAALTSNNLWFHGPSAMAANNGQRVKMYAPTTWNGGSSYSHLDTPTFQSTSNKLMVHSIAPGSSIHAPGTITIGLMKDLGWPQPQSSSTIVSLTSGQTVSGSVGLNSWKKYKITSSSSDTQLKVDMTNLSADVDLYVQKGAEPTSSSYLCRPYSGGTTSETCTLPNSGAATWYISVYGYQAGSFSIKATLSGTAAPAITTLTSGQAVSGAAGQNEWKRYKITSSSSDTQLKVDMTSLSADLDLYVQSSSEPTATSYQCRPYNGGTASETCTLPNSGAATWYISVYGYEAGSYNLKATLLAY